MAYVKNKNAFFNYTIKDRVEAGIVLKGHEVKAIKSGGASLRSSWCSIVGGELLIHEFNIPPYKHATLDDSYNPTVSRKLMIKKSEIQLLERRKKGEHITLVPLSVYGKKGKIKVEVAVAIGKKKHDKREDIKRREFERDIGRQMKKRRID